VLIAAALSVAGCAAVPTLERKAPPNLAVAEAATIPGLTGVRSWGDFVPKDAVQEYHRIFPGLPQIGQNAPRIDGRPVIKVLALSGGGPDGAFGAGLLSGWTARGDRPEFQFVTGISAGALIAPFAYLGSAYDEPMREIWTQYETSELITAQLLPGLLGGPSLADTAPLAALIAKYVDRAFLAKIAAEYSKGRILLIGTTNLDAQRPVVWNMGAIARAGTPAAVELFRQVLLASSAIPGAFPPVNIKVVADGQSFDEMHVDGGTTREVFITPVQASFRSLDKLYDQPPLRHIYIVKNGKIGADYTEVKPKTLAIASRAIATLLKRQHSGDIYRIYRDAKDGGAEFNLIAVPEAFSEKPKQAFDPVYQKALFETGYKMGRGGIKWLKIPPELLPTLPTPRPPPVPVTVARNEPQASATAVPNVFDILGGH
jgi:predicted acylesterase/phospholipase RssA